MSETKPTIGVIGSGRLGTAIAKQALKAGYVVRIANSKGPDSLKLILNVLLPEAIGSTVEDTILLSEIVILAIPLNRYIHLPRELFSGKVIIDAMNYWPPTEGKIDEFENSTSSEYLQNYFSEARLVKTLNHVAYNELEEHSLPKSEKGRRVIVLAGNDTSAKQQVAQFIDAIGFDAVDIGFLDAGSKFQPDTKLFNTRFNKEELDRLL
jgi:predicted dinucleotide-binding enzyme